MRTAQEMLDAAIAFGTAGYRVFPCVWGTKKPAVTAWPLLASSDEDEIRAMWGDKLYNIGLACGPQPNGINLIAIDVDPKNGGTATWRALCAEHGRAGLDKAPIHRTPHDGWHLFCDAPDELRNTRNKLGDGVDTRGDGGYVVVPPSEWANGDGELLAYRATSGLLERHPIAMPLWTIEILSTPDPASARTVFTAPDGDGRSVWDWVRANVDWHDLLMRFGWTFVRWLANGDELWRRPDKDTEHSAVLHLPDGPLVNFSTSVLTDAGVPTAGAVGRSMSKADFWAAYVFDGNLGALAQAVSEMPVYQAWRDSAGPPIEIAPVLYPPREFYEQRPWMTACRRMAEAVGGSPAAHLMAFMCRWATLIPPSYTIPPYNGAPSSFDLIGVIAGTSGSGKTAAMRNAEVMLPVQRTDLRMGLGLGSGEGIIEAYYQLEDVVDDDGKHKRKERRRTIVGVNFAIDEGMILAELAQRAGATHVTRLCTGWSGGAQSTTNASAENFRHIDAGQYRLTAVMGIQADRAHELMTDTATSQGFVGRLLFCWSEEPRAPERPDYPEPFALTVPAKIGPPVERGCEPRFTPAYLTYPTAVIAEVRAANDARAGTAVPVEEHHHDLMRLKVAGIVALMDARTNVSEEDWEIATTLVECSKAIRCSLYERRRATLRDARHASAEAQADREAIVEDAHEARYIARLADRMWARLRAAGDKGIGRGKLIRDVTAHSTRHLGDAAIERLIRDGRAVVAEGRVRALG